MKDEMMEVALIITCIIGTLYIALTTNDFVFLLFYGIFVLLLFYSLTAIKKAEEK